MQQLFVQIVRLLERFVMQLKETILLLLKDCHGWLELNEIVLFFKRDYEK